MKKKILILCLILTALISAFAIGTVAAEEEPALKIEAANLEFADNVYLWYAVSHEGIDTNDIKMLFFTEPQSEYTTENADYYANLYKDGENVAGKENCAIFCNTALRARNMADDIYAVAYVAVDGKEYYSEPVKYSILRYAYNKLGKTGVASENEALKEALSAMLEYGATVQVYTDYKTDRLANADFYQVKVEGGTLSDGFNKGLYLAGESISLSAPAQKDGKAFFAWQNSAGEAIAHTAEATVILTAKNEIYTAFYGEPIVYSQGLTFISNGDGTCIVSGKGNCTDTDIVIPPTSPVGDSVTSIGFQAFMDNRISSVTIPNSVTSIEKMAFIFCTSLTSMKIPDSVTSIGENAFAECSNLTSVTIGNGVTSIEKMAFSDCTSLASVTIGDNVTSIGDWAFSGCTSLTSITIPDSVTSIGGWVFSDCTSLASVTIGDSMGSIGKGAFEDCDSLTSITATDKNTAYQSIDGNLYSKDGSVLVQYAIGKQDAHFEIPSTITSIGSYAFSYCESLTNITIPDSVTGIGDRAFYHCTSLASVTIGDNVTSIGNQAFYGCTSLSSVYYRGTAEEWSAITVGSSNDPLTNATRYYYSEETPTEEGNFWHYSESGEIKI